MMLYDGKAILAKLLRREPLDAGEIGSFLAATLTSQIDDAVAAAVLIGLRMKGETASEVGVAVEALRRFMTPFDAGGREVIDTCGTGGDGANTFNVSTATALVIASCGVPVVKHGNRSVSSRSGSADVLASLGVPIEESVEHWQHRLAETNFAFCFAPKYHPAMKSVAPIRQKLGVPTIFNLLGPLANPARPAFQILGVGRADLLDVIAGALCHLGSKGAYVVHADGGLDEISLWGRTEYRHVTSAKIEVGSWLPSDFGLPACELKDIKVADAAESATMIEAVLSDVEGPAKWMTLANAAVVLMAAGAVATLREGVERAAEAIQRGAARSVLDRVRGLCSEESRR